MKNIEIATFDTSTPSSMKADIKFESDNPNYKLINSRLDFTWYFEKIIDNE